MKNWCSIIFVSVLFLFGLPSFVHAKIWINEFSSDGSSDWIELYNDAADSVNLNEYKIRDSSATNKLDLTGQIDANGYAVFEWGSKLNNGGDSIKLVSATDENNVIDQVVYGDSADIGAPQSGQSAGRRPNGGTSWVLFTTASKGISNADSPLVPTPTAVPENTPTPAKEPTPTRVPTPTKAPATKAPTPTVATKVETQLATNTSTSSFKISGLPTPILGVATQSATPKPSPKISMHPEKKVLVKSASASPFIALIVGAIFFLACGILIFVRKRRKKYVE